MMKKFILIVCGSFVGTFLAFMFFMIAAMVMSFAIMGSMGRMGSSKSTVSVTKHSIARRRHAFKPGLEHARVGH